MHEVKLGRKLLVYVFFGHLSLTYDIKRPSTLPIECKKHSFAYCKHSFDFNMKRILDFSYIFIQNC